MSMRSPTAGPRQRERTLLFVHIPKAAGTSVQRFLYHQLPAQECLLDPPRPETIDSGLDRYRLVAGHLDYDFAERFARRPFVLTCLRHPIERALSSYYNLRTPRAPIELETMAQSGVAMIEKIIEDVRRLNRYDTLADFLRSEPDLARSWLGNVQTGYLAGGDAVAKYASQPDRLLAVACEHLRACDGVLLAERLAETLGAIDPGWGERARTSLRHDNANLGRPALHEHASDVIDALTELTALDLELYRLAEQLVEGGGSPGRLPAPFAVPERAPPDFHFDQPIPGHGWHVRECHEGTWFCWTNEQAALTMNVAAKGDHELRCEVRQAASLGAWTDLAVSVNGHPVALAARTTAPPAEVTARVPGAWLGSQLATVAFRVADTVRPCDHDPGNPDTRCLGLAFSRIRLVPVATH